MEDIYASCREEAEKKEQEEIKKGLERKTIINRCEDFRCCFAGTVLCVADNCCECVLNNCRGCKHLEECFDKMMEV